MASVTHMGVAATDHVVLYALRNIAGGCAQAGYEFFRAKVGGLGSAPNPDVDPPSRVRRGWSLVVTDIDWDYIHPRVRPRRAPITSWSCESSAWGCPRRS